MAKKRTIGIFTGSRSEYGLLLPVIRAIMNHPDLDYRLVVSGTHLDSTFGSTIDRIVDDGFQIYAEVPINRVNDELSSTATAIGSGIGLIVDLLAKLRPDIWLVYGDRFETFAAAIASSQMGIPTAHIEGGDRTEGGALDDSVRHAITKLAHLHFPTNEPAADLIKQLGEENWRVENVGFPAIDAIINREFATKEETLKRFSLDDKRPIILFTQHSVAVQHDQAVAQIRPSLTALEKLAVNDGAQILITYPNSDAGGSALIDEINRFRKRNISGVQFHQSLGQRYYYGVLNLCGHETIGGGVCVGNSSSGLKETPAFGAPAVNIGSRQNGRLAAENVIHVDYDASQIEAAMQKCLSDQTFIEKCHSCSNPYGTGQAGQKIANTLASVSLDEKLLIKKMTSLAI